MRLGCAFLLVVKAGGLGRVSSAKAASASPRPGGIITRILVIRCILRFAGSTAARQTDVETELCDGVVQHALGSFRIPPRCSFAGPATTGLNTARGSHSLLPVRSAADRLVPGHGPIFTRQSSCIVRQLWTEVSPPFSQALTVLGPIGLPCPLAQTLHGSSSRREWKDRRPFFQRLGLSSTCVTISVRKGRRGHIHIFVPSVHYNRNTNASVDNRRSTVHMWAHRNKFLILTKNSSLAWIMLPGHLTLESTTRTSLLKF